jgi:hypothetical protein
MTIERIAPADRKEFAGIADRIMYYLSHYWIVWPLLVIGVLMLTVFALALAKR